MICNMHNLYCVNCEADTIHSNNDQLLTLIFYKRVANSLGMNTCYTNFQF